MPSYTLRIPRWRPPLANAWRGRHWSVAHRLRKEASAMLATYARLQAIPPATGPRRASLEIVLAPRQRRPDRDAFDKLLLDAMVSTGLLLDDSDRGLSGRLEIAFRRGTADDWGTVLYLTDTGK